VSRIGCCGRGIRIRFRGRIGDRAMFVVARGGRSFVCAAQVLRVPRRRRVAAFAFAKRVTAFGECHDIRGRRVLREHARGAQREFTGVRDPAAQGGDEDR